MHCDATGQDKLVGLQHPTSCRVLELSWQILTKIRSVSFCLDADGSQIALSCSSSIYTNCRDNGFNYKHSQSQRDLHAEMKT